MKIDLAATLLRLTYLCIIVWLGFDGVFYSIRRVIQYPNQVNLIFSSVLPSFALIFAILWLISDIRMTSPRWQFAFQLVHVIPFLPSLLLILIAPLFLLWSGRSMFLLSVSMIGCMLAWIGISLYTEETQGVAVSIERLAGSAGSDEIVRNGILKKIPLGASRADVILFLEEHHVPEDRFVGGQFVRYQQGQSFVLALFSKPPWVLSFCAFTD